MAISREDEIFIGERLAETAGAAGIGTADLLAFLTGGFAAPDGAALTRALFARPRLRQDFRALQERMAFGTLPILAAASDGALEVRRFEGGEVTIVPPGADGGQAYLLLRLEPGDSLPGPLNLVMTGRDGDIALRRLPAPDALGEIMVILDPAVAEDALLLRLVADAASAGALVAAG